MSEVEVVPASVVGSFLLCDAIPCDRAGRDDDRWQEPATSASSPLHLRAPRSAVTQHLEEPEAMTRRGVAPEPPEQARDDDVLLRLGSLVHIEARLHHPVAPGALRTGDHAGVQDDSTVAAPFAQTVGLMPGFWVSPFQFQDQFGTGGVAHRGHPGGVTTRLERISDPW